jgi:hypothetical protein
MGLEVKENHIPDSLYLTKKLESSTLCKVLDSNVFTVDRLYLLVNDQVTKIDLVDQKQDNVHFKLYVRLNWAFAGPARIQVGNIKGWRILLKKKPKWTLRAVVETTEHHTIYTFEHKYTNINNLHKGIEEELDYLHGLYLEVKQK